jgi:hypothetical protein
MPALQTFIQAAASVSKGGNRTFAAQDTNGC